MLALEPITPFLFSSKSTFFGNKNSCHGRMSLPANKNYGPFHHNRQLSNLPNEHSLVQVSAGFRDVGTKPHFLQQHFPVLPLLYSGPYVAFFMPLLNPPQRNLRIRPTKNLLYRNLFLDCQLHRYHHFVQQQTSH